MTRRRRSSFPRTFARRAVLKASAAASATLLGCGTRTPLEPLTQAGPEGAGGGNGGEGSAGEAGEQATGGAVPVMADPALVPEDV